MFISKVIFKTLFAVAVLGQNAIVFAVSDDHNIPSSKLANNDGSPTTALRGGSAAVQDFAEEGVVSFDDDKRRATRSTGRELLEAVMVATEEEDSSAATIGDDNSNNNNGNNRKLQTFDEQLMYCGDDKFKWKYSDYTQIKDEWGSYWTKISWYGCNPGKSDGKRWVCTTDGFVTVGDTCDNGGTWKECCM